VPIQPGTLNRAARSVILFGAGLLLLLAAVHERSRLSSLIFPLWVRTTSDVPYGPLTEHRLDLMERRWPAGALRPAAVVFHGGGWLTGSRDSVRMAFCRPYLANGFLVANVAYRLGDIPQAVDDAGRALNWIYANASAYGIDPDRVVVTGVSAGAHLALLAGFQSRARPGAVVNFYGVTDMTAMLHLPSIRRVLPPEDLADTARRVSPIAYVRASLPPVLSIHGSADEIVPIEHTHKLTEAIRRAGGDAEEFVIEGGAHGLQPGQQSQANEAVFRFLRSRGVLR
jgi:acetyl esterase/lipase